jgi:hypothetical protein
MSRTISGLIVVEAEVSRLIVQVLMVIALIGQTLDIIVT